MSRARKRADRIREEVPLDEVLYRYGYELIPNADREQQFSCDLHGDGSDSKPSARFYPDSTSWHCFACSKSRDALGTVMAKEGLSFSEACTSLEKAYGLPPLPWEDEDRPKKVNTEIETGTVETPDDASARVLKLLQAFSIGKDMTLDDLLRMWEIHDRVMYLHREGTVKDTKVIDSLTRIKKTAMRLAREQT